MTTDSLYIGLMSGTSMDGVDGVLVRLPADDAAPAQVLHHTAVDMPGPLRRELMALNSTGPDELHRAALAANALTGLYADVVLRLLDAGGLAPSAVRAIGAHGQTVRHQPQAFNGTGYTLQLQNPSLLAERTGIDVVADFRSRDVAAGGQGAPLVPAFHRRWFGRPDVAVAVLNLGGIANISLLAAGDQGATTGFDCGPGNAMLDHWCQRHLGLPFDADGAWGVTGRVLPALLVDMLATPFFEQPPPRSTGRDLFNPAWLEQHLARHAPADPVDVQATLVELTVQACAASATSYGKDSTDLIVCGGGAFNGALMAGLARALPGMRVVSSARFGLPPLQVEATAFAWLAQRWVERRPGNLPAVTGAAGPRLLGALYPA